MRSRLIIFIILFISTINYAQVKKGSLFFDEVRISLNTALQFNADILCPNEFETAKQYYLNALELNNNLKSNEEIKTELEKSVSIITKMNEKLEKKTEIFKPILNARDSALFNNADKYAGDYWEKAEDGFKDLVEELQDNDLSDPAQIYEIVKYYNLASKYGAEANYILSGWTPLRNADQNLANLLYPDTYLKGYENLSNVLGMINSGTEITEINDVLKSAEKQFNTAAENSFTFKEQHPKILQDRAAAIDSGAEIYASKLWTKGEMNLEEAGKSFEEKDNADVNEYIKTARINYLSAAQVASVEKPITFSPTPIYKRNILTKPNTRKSKLIISGNIYSIFKGENVTILRQSNGVKLLFGNLSFNPMGTMLNNKDKQILNKVIYAINSFPKSNVKIYSFTDNIGIKSMNKELSQKRADNIRKYLIKNSQIDPSRISSIGMGELNPIASNKTFEGRKKNNRIEIVIKKL